MALLRFNRCVCIFFLAAVALSGCSQGGSQWALAPQPSTQSTSARFATSFGSEKMRADASPHISSAAPPRMPPQAATEDLLYVSNLHNVAIFSYPQGKRVGTLRVSIRKPASALTPQVTFSSATGIP